MGNDQDGRLGNNEQDGTTTNGQHSTHAYALLPPPQQMQQRPKCQQLLFEPQVFFFSFIPFFFCQLTVFLSKLQVLTQNEPGPCMAQTPRMTTMLQQHRTTPH
jgi:hypothetical protein